MSDSGVIWGGVHIIISVKGGGVKGGGGYRGEGLSPS